jgi:tetratricopeptide (TPR) repeat protein
VEPAEPRDVLGFDLDEDSWIDLVRASCERPGYGRLGSYELLGEVGRGGQGIVYRALQPHTGRTVALKRLTSGVFASGPERARFEREVEAAAALDHPGIVTVYGSDLIDGQPVLLLQYVEGAPIDRWAASGPDGGRRAPHEVLEAFARICDAVHHAHQRGVIHRDLKPGNLLVDGEGQPHVLDFGLAKREVGAAQSSGLTLTGQFLGTPLYAAPEQLRGDAAAVDVQTDVYALGAVLYQALTGRTLVEPGIGLAALVEAVQTREPRPPSAVDPRLDREIDAIVLKAVAKEKARRYPSVEALGADVRRRLAGEVVLALPPSAGYRVRKFVGRHKATVGIAAALVLTLAAAAPVLTILYLNAEQERTRASAELEERVKTERRRSREMYRVLGSEALLNEMLRKAHQGARHGVPAITVREALDQVAADLERGKEELSVQPEIEVWLRMMIGNTYRELALPLAARVHLERVLQLRRLLPPPETREESLDVAETMEKLGRVCRELGDLGEAERLLEGAFTLRRELVGPDNPYRAVSANSLAILKRHLGKLAEAEALYLEALRIYRLPKTRGGYESVPVALKNLALVYLDQRRNDEASRAMREAYDLALRLHGETHLDVASIQLNLSTALLRTGWPVEAEVLARKAIDTLVHLGGDRQRALAQAQERLAEVLRKTGRPGEARAAVLEALESHRVGGNATDVARCLGAHAVLLRELGRSGEAERVLREALVTAAGAISPSQALIARHRATLGALLADQACFDDAEKLLHEAEPALASLVGEGDEALQEARRELVRVRERRADPVLAGG